MAIVGTKQEYRAPIQIAQAVAAHAFGLPLAAIANAEVPAGPQAFRGRQLAIYLSRSVLKRSLRGVGRAFGRTHPTVLHACRRIEEEREDPVFDRTVEWLEMLVRRAARVAA
ncbi:MAG: chromosomal replication initiator DnaA [Alphaproteobacteria bacterium]|nr:chromosomal replication initiator DnaA [Alphaproteobacteria bacterium]